MITLGTIVQDTITGFTGVAVCRTEWLHGCTRIGVESQRLDKDGKAQDPQHFDEQRVVTKGPFCPSVTLETGGPQPDPQAKRGL